MPIYTYQCEKCGEFEEHQSMADPPLECCPTCGNAVQRVITGGSGFIMKGQGASASHCGQSSPCCGRETRCDEPPCGK